MPGKTGKSRVPGERYERLEDRAAKGDFSALVDPLDYLVLEKLPDEGEMVLGYFPAGETSGGLAKDHFGGVLSPSQMAQRLLLLKRHGLAVQVKSLSSSTDAWQKTKKGREIFEAWRAKNDGVRGTN